MNERMWDVQDLDVEMINSLSFLWRSLIELGFNGLREILLDLACEEEGNSIGGVMERKRR